MVTPFASGDPAFRQSTDCGVEINCTDTASDNLIVIFRREILDVVAVKVAPSVVVTT
jgi:hypothetical protein